MAKILNGAAEALVVVGEAGGRTMIPTGTPLTRLNYFDGKFLRAEHLRAEQDYLRSLVHLSNQAGGRGVVHGLDATVDGGDRLRLSPGMAVDGRGRLLLLPVEADMGVADLLEASRRATPDVRARVGEGGHVAFEACATEPATDADAALPTEGLYLVLLSHVEALCGHEDVYGRLCEDDCARTGDRPWRLEGVVLRALPLILESALPASSAVSLDRRHLRSRVASAYFADARRSPASLVSPSGLASEAWCRGAEAPDSGDVPLGVLARRGGTTLFLDAWTARRERMEAPPSRYWDHRMAMRPRDLFMAEILQFQCQLRDILESGPEEGGGEGPCGDEREALREASRLIESLRERAAGEGASGGGTSDTGGERPEMSSGSPSMPGGWQGVGEDLQRVNQQLAQALRGSSGGRRILVEGGIVELPPAGYLPVDPAAERSVDRQVRALVGEGVDLRFCAVRPDFVAHALEEARHMDRVSLLRGLDDATARPEVDVLVPDGRILPPEQDVSGLYDVRLEVTPPHEALPQGHRLTHLEEPRTVAVPLRGAARGAADADGGGVVHLAVAPGELPEAVQAALMELAMDVAESVARERKEGRTSPREEEATASPDQPELEEGLEARRMMDADGNTEEMRETESVRGERWVAAVQDLRMEGGARVALRVERDPFSLAPGDSVRVEAELDLGLSVAGHTITIQVELDGRVRLTSVAGAGDERRRLEGRLSRMRAVMTPWMDGRVGPIEADALDLRVGADLRLTDAGPVEAELRLDAGENLRFVASATWTRGVMEGRVEARGVEDGEVRVYPLARGSGRPDAEVGGGSHPAHVAAARALDIIGRGLRDAGYRPEMERTLFRPPAEGAGDPVVRGPHGWVLFHRRRVKSCGPSRAPAPELPARSYRTLLVRVDEPAQVKAVRRAVATGDGDVLRELEPEAVGTVAFRGGTAELSSPGESLRTAWLALEPGRLVYGAVAPDALRGEDDPALARDRLRRLESVVDPDDAVQPLLETAARVPSGLELGGADGVVLLVTTPEAEPATVTHHVFVVDADARSRLLEVVGSDGISTGEPNSIFDSLTEPLGTVTFREGTATPEGGFPGDVVDAWREAEPDHLPGAAAVVLQSGDAETRALQARAVVTGLGGAVESVATVSLGPDLPMPFEAVTLVTPGGGAPAMRQARIYAYEPPADDRNVVIDDESLVVAFDQINRLAGAGITSEMAAVLGERAPYRELQIATREGAVDDADAHHRLEVTFEALSRLQLMDGGAVANVVALADHERDLLDRDGVSVDDVLLLDVGEPG